MKGIPSASTLDTLPSSSSCFSKRDQRLCLRAKQPNGSEPETGYEEEFRGNEIPDVQERGEPLRDEGTQWIFVESEIKTFKLLLSFGRALLFTRLFKLDSVAIRDI